MSAESARCDRPLGVRCGAFGDMVLLTAMIRELHARFRRPVDLVTSGSWSEPLLAGQPGVGEIFCVRSRKTPYLLSVGQRRVVRGLRRRGIGPTWYCDGTHAAMAMLVRAGIPRDLIVDVAQHPLLAGEHATEQWHRLAQIMPEGLETPPPPGRPLAGGCQLAVSAAQLLDLKGWLQKRGIGTPLVVVQAGNKRTMRRGPRRLAVNHKYWPAARWAEVIRHLRGDLPQHAIVLLGTGPEFALNREIAALAGVSGVYNAADDLPIARLVALLARASALIGVDSGPAHAAAAVGCPQVVLFGRASPTLYRPRGTAGAEVRLLTGEVNGQPNMLGIAAKAVIEAWDGLTLRLPQGA